VSRLYQPSAGSVDFQDKDLLKAEPHDIARLGIGRTFQNLALFGTMTVLDNRDGRGP
jgi:branched-chain amino acid transport system ATP-binding protein